MVIHAFYSKKHAHTEVQNSAPRQHAHKPQATPTHPRTEVEETGDPGSSVPGGAAPRLLVHGAHLSPNPFRAPASLFVLLSGGLKLNRSFGDSIAVRWKIENHSCSSSTRMKGHQAFMTWISQWNILSNKILLSVWRNYKYAMFGCW